MIIVIYIYILCTHIYLSYIYIYTNISYKYIYSIVLDRCFLGLLPSAEISTRFSVRGSTGQKTNDEDVLCMS